jgi:HlyD family type I secretion membrane fusion protein
MANNKEKLSPEKLKQLEELRKMMIQHSGGDVHKGELPNIPKRPSIFTPKGLLIAILQGMQNSVKFIDYFIDFVIRKDSQKTNDVVKASRSPIMFGTFVVIFFVVFGVLWAGTAPLDSASYAIGTIVSNTKKKIINHPQGGIIKEIYVKLGDKVHKDDKLLEFDQTRIRADYENTLNQYRSLLASERRLLAEINSNTEIEYPEFITKDKSIPDVSTIIETQNNLFKARNELKSSKKQSLKQKLKQLDKQIEGQKAKITALEKTISVTKERLESTRQLYNKGFAQKSAVLELESRLANAEGESAMTKTEIARLEQEITITEISLINVDNEFATDALDKLKDTQTRMTQARESLVAQEDALNRVVIRSPVEGVVNNLNYFTIGSSIPPQQTILEVSPVDDKLVIEARIEPRHIDSIRIGLKSKIRFSAFKSRTTPLFTGEVVSLSPDIIVPTQASPKDPTSGGYYLAQIEIDMDEFNEVAKTHKLVLHPGMQAEVQIIKGSRTLLRYLLDPVIDAMFRGFKEK